MLSMANEKYEYCFFCETVKEEQLTCPLLITRTDIKVGAGYESLLDILRQFFRYRRIAQYSVLEKK